MKKNDYYVALYELHNHNCCKKLELVDQNGNAEYPIEDVIIYLTYTARKGGTNA